MPAYDGTVAPTYRIQVRDTRSVPVWADLPSSDTRNVSIRRGRSSANQSMDAGTMYVTIDDTSGAYDPDNATSTWYPLFRAATKARLVATWSTVDYVLFTGWLESTEIDHGAEPAAVMTFVDAVGRISAIPTMAIPNSLYDTDYDDEAVDNVTAGTGRVQRLWTSGLLTFVDNTHRPDDCLRKMTPIRRGSNLTQILDECALVEAGKWYITRDNYLGFYRCDNKFDRPTRITLSDSRVAGTVEYDVLRVSPGASLLCNDARMNTPGRNSNDEQYWFQYTSSVTSYGIKSDEFSAPVFSSDWASTLAMFFCRRWATPSSYASRVEFDAFALGSLYPNLLQCELGDLLTIERTTVDGRALTWQVFIEGLDHDITATSWRVGFDTSPADGYYPADATSGTPTNITTITPVPLAITSTTGYTFGTIIDRIRVADSKDVQLEGMLELGAATGTLNLNTRQYQVFACESNATANFTVNLRGTSSVSLAKSLRKGDSVTATLFVKNGTTAYRCTTVKVDGTTKVQGTDLTWTGGTAPGSGTASGWDEYQFTAVKYQDGTIRVRASVAGAK